MRVAIVGGTGAFGRALAASGQLHLQLLTLDGEPIAHNIGCIHRDVYYYVKTSYAAAHRPASPPAADRGE